VRAYPHIATRFGGQQPRLRAARDGADDVDPTIFDAQRCRPVTVRNGAPTGTRLPLDQDPHGTVLVDGDRRRLTQVHVVEPRILEPRQKRDVRVHGPPAANGLGTRQRGRDQLGAVHGDVRIAGLRCRLPDHRVGEIACRHLGRLGIASACVRLGAIRAVASGAVAAQRQRGHTDHDSRPRWHPDGPRPGDHGAGRSTVAAADRTRSL
jgi:hypothetical protein